MRRAGRLLIALAALLPSIALAADIEKECGSPSRRQLQAVVEFLADDLLEGRAPGTPGGRLAENYIRSLFKLIGLEPGSQNGFLQPFAIRGFTTRELMLSDGRETLRQPADLVGSYTREESQFDLEAETVFVGFGIRTPILAWDDFKQADLRGKLLIVRANEPGLFRPKLAKGKGMSFFGRWSYKVEEAIRCGAAGLLIIHTDQTAGYGWSVVQNSWSGEEIYLPADIENPLRFRGWISETGLRRLLANRHIDLEGLYRRSLQKRFRPVELGFRMHLSGKNAGRALQANNVVGMIPGRSDRQIVISAHLDHLGRNRELPGDQIFNGAIDNAAPLAALIGLARQLHECRSDPYYSFVFLACNAEEAGLLGSKYFVLNADRRRIIANVNFESTPVWGPSRDIFGIGAHYSTFEELLKQIAAAEGWEYGDFSIAAAQGFFYRSDQFPFARCNIPAIWISAGEHLISGRNELAPFFRGGNYHTVRDEYNPDWEMAGLLQTIRLTRLLVERIDQNRQPPRWTGPLPFPLYGD